MQNEEIGNLEKSKGIIEAQKESACCTPKSNETVCCTPSKSGQENGGACCAQPADGSPCCDK